MRLILSMIIILLLSWNCSSGQVQGDSSEDYLSLSVLLLKSIQDGNLNKDVQSKIEESSFNDIAMQINTDDKKIAFWVNIYNSYIQIYLRDKPELYEDKRAFFKADYIPIAGSTISFEKIEHGILRRSQNPLGLGYIRKLFPGKFERKLRVNKRDHRVHFALNCGAKSCPPVGIYNLDNLDKQLDDMGQYFLTKFTSYNGELNEVETTALFSWFRGDFGGKSGVRKILRKYELIPNSKVDINYATYDWTLYLDNFIEIDN